jgi:hypothetical protein
MFAKIKAALAVFDATHARSAWQAEVALTVELLKITHSNEGEIRRRVRVKTLTGLPLQGIWS